VVEPKTSRNLEYAFIACVGDLVSSGACWTEWWVVIWFLLYEFGASWDGQHALGPVGWEFLSDFAGFAFYLIVRCYYIFGAFNYGIIIAFTSIFSTLLVFYTHPVLVHSTGIRASVFFVAISVVAGLALSHYSVSACYCADCRIIHQCAWLFVWADQAANLCVALLW